MEENKNYPDKQDSPSSRIAGLILIVLGLLIMILLFGDFVKALLISLSVFLLSYGFTLAIGKYRLAIFLVILIHYGRRTKKTSRQIIRIKIDEKKKRLEIPGRFFLFQFVFM